MAEGPLHRQNQVQFRSVLPHEPLPAEDVGYVHLQGAFEPKKKDPEAPDYWKSPEDLQAALMDALSTRYSTFNLPFPVKSILVLSPDNPPFNKVRLIYSNPAQAIALQACWRDQKISPAMLLSSPDNDSSVVFTSGSFQVTVVTTLPIPTNSTTSWLRSNPPKFRRLLHEHDDHEERSITRFLYVTGLIPQGGPEEDVPIASYWRCPYMVVDSIRQCFNTFDSTQEQVEVFLSKKQQSNGSVATSCHIGMRTPQDCQRVVHELQGKSVTWNYQGEEQQSGSLFLDFVSVTQKSMAKSKARQQHNNEWERGQPSRPECTSTTDHVQVPGLVLLENFLSEGEEEVLMAALTGPQAPWAPDQTNKSLTGAVKRSVQHYGYVFDYQTADVLRDRQQPGADCPPLPECTNYESSPEYVKQGRGWELLGNIIERTRRQEFTVPNPPGQDGEARVVSYPDTNQLTVNQYRPGEGIGSHVDTPSAFGEGLMSISLNSGIVMEFKKVSQSDDEPPLKKLVYLPARSIVLMTGASRYEWEHHIVTRRTDTHQGKVLTRKLRVSLTMRTALALEGESMPRVESCTFPPTWGNASQSPKKHLATPDTERDHVHAVYDAIATQWHHTRDCGCGDGKYFPAIIEAGSYVIGTDISRPLLETAFLRDEDLGSGTTPDLRRVSADRQHLRNRPAVAVADCMSVPLRSKSCDAAICIAVMHHLSTKERRIRCIEELARVVRVGGMINIQAWAMEQDQSSRRRFAGTDVFVPFNAQPKYLEKAQQQKASEMRSSDEDKQSSGSEGKSVAEAFSETFKKADYDEKKGLVVFQRYCHMYRTGEMEELVGEIPGVKLVESGYESGNHFVILEALN
eukprot:Nitzschia sp. Nitz4//scaffold38_size140716//310//2943//NITZ4_003123-RA/size140716-processed-gene-0.50-mRNA-1//-1//CDS//3329550006//6154//frame0